MTSIQITKNKIIEASIFLALLTFTGIAFSFGLTGTFLLDDFSNIQPALIDSFNYSELVQAVTNNRSGIFGRPVSVLSFSLTGLAHGDWIWGFKYHNILIHLLIGITVFCLLERLLKILSTSTLPTYPIALCTTAVWLLHPLQVSTVMYAVQRMTQLSALFSILAILVFLKGIQTISNRKKIIHYFVLFPITLLLSVLSKENGVLTPVFIAMIILAIVFSSTDIATDIKLRIKTNRYDQLYILAFILIPIVIGAVGFAYKHESLLDYSNRPFNLEQRLLSQVDIVFLYIKQLLIPRLSSMGLFFDDIPIAQSMTFLRGCKLLAISGLFITGIIATIRGKSILGLGILFYFSGHLLESTIIPLELTFEHRNYLPSIGIFMVVCFYIINICRVKKPAIIVASIWASMLVSLLFLRLDFWSNEHNWLQTTLAYHPKSERTQLEYIAFLSRAGKDELVFEKIDEARKALPEKISFHIKKLLIDCDDKDAEENKQTRETLFNLVFTKPLTTIGFNALGELVNDTLTKQCKSIPLSTVYAYVGAAMERQENENKKSRNYGFLSVLRAKQELFMLGNREKAYSLYMQGFELTGSDRLAIWAVKALLGHPETRKKGLEKLEEIEAGKYFNPSRQQDEIDNLREKLDANDFNFRL